MHPFYTERAGLTIIKNLDFSGVFKYNEGFKYKTPLCVNNLGMNVTGG